MTCQKTEIRQAACTTITSTRRVARSTRGLKRSKPVTTLEALFERSPEAEKTHQSPRSTQGRHRGYSPRSINAEDRFQATKRVVTTNLSNHSARRATGAIYNTDHESCGEEQATREKERARAAGEEGRWGFSGKGGEGEEESAGHPNESVGGGKPLNVTIVLPALRRTIVTFRPFALLLSHL